MPSVWATLTLKKPTMTLLPDPLSQWTWIKHTMSPRGTSSLSSWMSELSGKKESFLTFSRTQLTQIESSQTRMFCHCRKENFLAQKISASFHKEEPKARKVAHACLVERECAPHPNAESTVRCLSTQRRTYTSRICSRERTIFERSQCTLCKQLKKSLIEKLTF